jgi:hypothetical protein
VFKRCVLITAAVAALAGTAPVGAQSITSPYDFVEKSRGIYAYGTYVATNRGVIGIGPGSGPAAGLGFAIRVSGPFTLDSRVAYFSTTRTIYDVQDAGHDPETIREEPMTGLVEVGSADVTAVLTDLSLRFDVTGPRTWYRLQPYALIGVGGVFRVAEDNAAEEALPEGADLRVRFRSGITGHVGGGAEWYVTQRFTLRFDARSLFWRLHVPSGFITSARVIDDREWVQNGHLSLGVAFRF